MLGWEIFCSYKKSDGNAETIASWITGISGCDWLDNLAKAGLAKVDHHHGYPNRYELTLDLLLDNIIPTPPSSNSPRVIGEDYVSDGGNSNFKVNIDLIMDLDPKTVILVTAWDQS